MDLFPGQSFGRVATAGKTLLQPFVDDDIVVAHLARLVREVVVVHLGVGVQLGLVNHERGALGRPCLPVLTPAIVTVDLAALPGGTGCRVRVQYGDGVRTTVVASPALDVPTRPAHPVIELPPAQHVMSEDGWLSLHGRLDGDGDPDAIEWLLDGVVIAHGPRAGHPHAGVGPHDLVLRHGDESASMAFVANPASAAPSPEPQPGSRRGGRARL